MLNNTPFGSVNSEETTLIRNGVKIEGKITSSGNIRVDGEIKGDIFSNSNVTIGETGKVNGKISADAITIGGMVTGAVRAKGKLLLDSKANLKGDIYTKNLAIEAGAKFDGQSKTGDWKDSDNGQGTSEPNPDVSKMPIDVNVPKN
jgi:cytoskeletal protein CcmA (bactofilin family)